MKQFAKTFLAMLLALIVTAVLCGFQVRLTRFRSIAVTNSTIDSTPIGSLAPSTGAFSTISSTNPVTFGGKLIENAGVLATGVGFKHMRFNSCTTAAATNGTCGSFPTWPSAFADTNYTAVCVSENSSAAVFGVGSHTTTTINVVVQNAPGVTTAVTPIIDCIGIHD